MVQEKPTDQPIQKSSVRKQLLISASIISFLVLSTLAAVLYGSGYRFGFQKGEPKLSKTGLLHLTSTPTGAEVYIDGHLTTATNNTINLTPGKYTIKISKDGYSDWQKDVEIQKEVVLSVDALLLPKLPSLQSISTFGVKSVVADPSGTKLAFKIASNSARRNGVYVFDMTTRSFPVLAGQSSSTQLVDDTTDFFSKATLSWSPDGKQILASTSGAFSTPTYYLLNADGFNSTPSDVTATLPSITDAWQTQRLDKETARLKGLKPAISEFAHKNFRILSWSPDDNKIFYQASASSQMPVFLKPRRIGNNLLYERRDLKKGAIYVYDIKEDINTRIVDVIDQICTDGEENCAKPFIWFPDSEHLIYVHEKKIDLVEVDGSNMTTSYAGPFIDRYVFPWPDGSKLVILTNLNSPSVSPTLYTIGLK